MSHYSLLRQATCVLLRWEGAVLRVGGEAAAQAARHARYIHCIANKRRASL